MKACLFRFSFFAVLLSIAFASWATASDTPNSTTTAPLESKFAQCLINGLTAASADTTVGELRQQCEQLQNIESVTVDSALDRRVISEKITERNPFVITPHKPNYILPAAYNFDPSAANLPISDDQIDKLEMKFQVSMKMPIVTGLMKGKLDVWGAYTGTSWWQAYNGPISAPFRETNHEPELFVTYYPDAQKYTHSSSLIQFGFAHQSNGQSGNRSRSWNRLQLNYAISRGPWLARASLWHRIEEDPKDPSLIYDPSGDDNPDLLNYLGHGQLGLGYKWGRQDFTVNLRNGFSSKRAWQFDYTFPLGERIRGNVQYFDGYGESLIDYNVKTQRLGVGFALTDWF